MATEIKIQSVSLRGVTFTLDASQFFLSWESLRDGQEMRDPVISPLYKGITDASQAFVTKCIASVPGLRSATPVAPVKRGPGRPPGSKNKPKGA